MKYIYRILSVIFWLDSIILTAEKSFTAGLLVMYFASIVFTVIFLFYRNIKEVFSKGAMKTLRIILDTAFIIWLAFWSVLLVTAKDNADYSESAIIVLGSGVRADGTPTANLKSRLDGAIDYCSKNPDAVIIVSGGVNEYHGIVEADVMFRYLTENGIPEEKILRDSDATSTYENFLNSHRIMMENSIPDENICFVTNRFHIFRSVQFAKMTGFRGVAHISVGTAPELFLPSVFRESMAIAALYLLY